MNEMVVILLIALASYFIGSIPFGLLVGKSRGVDIRQQGSRNIGASNAGRVLGRRFFFLVFLLDMCKSLVPMLIASFVALRVPDIDRSTLLYLAWVSVGVAAMVGHVFPIYLGFKGGKGVATGAGVLLGLYPYFTLTGLIAIGVFIVVVLITRYISLASIIASFAFPIVYLIFGLSRDWDVFGSQLPLLIVGVLLSTLILLRHRENIRRLLAGTENKIR